MSIPITHPLVKAAVITSVLCAILLTRQDTEARPGLLMGGPHFGGGHFNIGAHFQGGFRPGVINQGAHIEPRAHPNLRPDNRVIPAHHHHHYPYHPYWPGYWAGAATATAVGAWAFSLPRSCVAVNIGGITYERCGNTWYHPSYRGSQVVYQVVVKP